MRTRVRLLIVALLIFLVLGGGVLVVQTLRTRWQNDARQQITDMLPNVAQRIRDFHRVKVDRGRKVWEVSASEAQYLSDEEMVVVTEPLISFYLEDGRSVALRGRAGKVFLGGKDLQQVELVGDIHMQFGDYAVRTDEARYDRAEEVILAPGRVQVSGRALDLEGNRLEIHMPTQRLRLRDNVRMVLRPEQAGDG